MKGQNTLILNQESLATALQEYLSRELARPVVVSAVITEGTTGVSARVTFEFESGRSVPSAFCGVTGCDNVKLDGGAFCHSHSHEF